MKPTIGRIVHYTNLGDRDGKYPPEIQAALITGVKKIGASTSDAPEPLEDQESSYDVDLHIFYRTGQFDLQKVPFCMAEAGSDVARGCWAWPAR